MVMTFTGTPASFVCLTGCRGVCAPARSSVRHKGYGLSYRGDRWYVYKRMFAFCTIFNYRVCVCHWLCVYIYIWLCEWETGSVYTRPVILCERVTGLYQSHRICSLPSVCLLLTSISTPQSFICDFFCRVIQSKSKLVLSTVYWSTNKYLTVIYQTDSLIYNTAVAALWLNPALTWGGCCSFSLAFIPPCRSNWTEVSCCTLCRAVRAVLMNAALCLDSSQGCKRGGFPATKPQPCIPVNPAQSYLILTPYLT